MKKPLIILASASPRRIELLKLIVKKFITIPSQVNEATIKAKSPEAFAIKAALAKAWEVALQNRQAVVIGADTIVVLGKKILGKPKSQKAARLMLKALAGKEHRVITGLAVVRAETAEQSTDFGITKVKMKKVGEKEIAEYVESGRPLDKAGAYGIQEIEEIFIEKIEGDYYNVVGLPLQLLKRMLQNYFGKIS